MTQEIRRTERRTLPISKIKKLVLLAKEQQLLRLRVGDIEIVPRIDANAPIQEPIKGPSGKPLSQRERDDYILFGPNAIMDTHE